MSTRTNTFWEKIAEKIKVKVASSFHGLKEIRKQKQIKLSTMCRLSLSPKRRRSCAHLKGNFLNFPKLTLLSVVHLHRVLWYYGYLNTNPIFLGPKIKNKIKLNWINGDW